MKAMTAKQLELKGIIANHMKANNQTYVKVGENQFLIFRRKLSRPPLNDELLVALYGAYAKRVGRGCTDTEAQEWGSFVNEHMGRLSTPSEDLVLSNKPPVSSLF